MSTYNDWKRLFQVAPIVLVNGIANRTSQNMLSFLALAMPGIFIDPTNASYTDLDNAFGAFNVYPGGTLCAQTVPMYPLADMTMAANAIVRDPNQISLIWETPMRGQNAWSNKLTTFINLKMMLDTHNNSGGLYYIMTPAYFYDNCILVALTDNSRAGNSLPQNAWRFDFIRPQIVQQDQAFSSQSRLMQKISGGLQNDGTWSGAMVGSQTGLVHFIPNMLNSPQPITPIMTGIPGPLTFQ